MHRFAVFLFIAVSHVWGQNIPVTGKAVPELAGFDAAIQQIMRKWAVPGAAVAITDQGRLVYARGFGYADREAGIPVQPTSQFRLASISKTITGMTILKLVEEGKLNLDARAMDLIPDLQPSTNPPADPRMRLVTVRQLLLHIAGFDREIDNDHVNFYTTASRLFGNSPVTNDLMTRYVISQRLDFDPGQRYAYGNSAYQILGRIIERVSGQPYLEAVHNRVLRPAGVDSVLLGRSLLSQRYPDEVKYYDYPGAPLSTTVVAPGATLPTPRPYNRRIELSDAYGGLVANAIDLARYVNRLEGRGGPAVLNASSLATITRRPPAPVAGNTTGTYNGLTWRIIPVTGGAHWWHSGGATGTRNLLVRRQNGRDWVILTNTRPEDEETIITDLFDAFGAAEAGVRSWPTHDLYADFAGPVIRTGVETLTFTYQQGSAAPAAQTVQVTTTPAGARFEAEASARWLKLPVASGAAPGGLAVAVDPAGLEPGSYETLLRISTTNAANGTRYLVVTLRVTAGGAVSGFRNSASQEPVTVAAAGSRVTIDGEATSIRVVDSANEAHTAVIVSASAKGTDFVLPEKAASGEAVIQVSTAQGAGLQGRLKIDAFSPALFSVTRDGQGTALGTWKRVAADGTETSGALADGPIELGEEADVTELRFLVTGTRGEKDPAAFAVRIGDQPVEVLSVEVAESEPGAEWVRVKLPYALAGSGEGSISLTVGGVSSNTLVVQIK